MFEGKPLIATGMHRSGTSLLAHLLSEAGVAMAIDRSEPSRRHAGGERKGHFEDKRFVEFHEAVVRRADPTARLLWEPDVPIRVSEGEAEGARALVAARSSPTPWGWKDPRTVLFLDFWAGLLPEAVFLFVYRSPDQVVDSLRRRGDREFRRRVAGVQTGFAYQRAMRSWTLYNSLVLDFIETRFLRCCLVDVDTLVADPEGTLRRVSSRLGIPLRAEAVSEIYDPKLLRRMPDAKVVRVLEQDAEARRVHNRLRVTGTRYMAGS